MRHSAALIERARLLRTNGLTIRAIANELSITYRTAQRWTTSKLPNKLPIQSRRYDKAKREWAVNEVTSNGRTMASVARELGVCVDTIRRWVRPDVAEQRREYNRRDKRKSQNKPSHLGQCCICGMTTAECVEKYKKGLALDHCHDTDKDRGYLCLGCNTLIGSAQESVIVLASAIQYLEHSRKKPLDLTTFAIAP